MLQRAREVHKQYNKSREAWRQGFLNGLGELGLQSGYQIASELQSNTWLADLAWLRSRKADLSDFDGLALACHVVWESPFAAHPNPFGRIEIPTYAPVFILVKSPVAMERGSVF